jgi:hypothetical protein
MTFLMTRDDEAEFARRLRAAIPAVRFFGGNAPGGPVSLAGIDSATAATILICNGGPAPGSAASWKDLPPQVCFHGSRRRDSPLESLRGPTLRSGDMSICFDDDDHATRKFVNKVWRILRAMTTNMLQRVNPASDAEDLGEVRDVHVAAHAIEWQREGGLLGSTSANIYFRAYGKIPDSGPRVRKKGP